MTYRDEFPDFDPATLPAIPPEWTDQSWHNDACPSFNTGKGIVVFVDFENTADREFEGACQRFCVQRDPETCDDNDVIFETDEWAEVLAFVESGKLP